MYDSDSLLTTAEVAEILRVTPGTIKKWRYRPNHRLKAIKIGSRTVRYDRNAVTDFLIERGL